MQTMAGHFPTTRMRRNRRTAWLRDLVQEHRLTVNDLIWPVFIHEGEKLATPVESMPGVERLSIDLFVEKLKYARDLGIPAVALFPSVEANKKTPDGKESFNSHNLVCRAIEAAKKAVPEVGIICDVALDPYTTHGHDGIVKHDDVDNDETIEVLCKQAVTQAKAGCDVIAPSDMMDGRIGAIRASLDKHGLTHVAILSYAVKYASAFYGPFREAVGSLTTLGKSDKRTYQMNPANSDEALREVALDVQEGADMVMVKPGMPYLDIIRHVRNHFSVPVFAYQVSGEYSMIKLAGKRAIMDSDQVMLETLLAFKRAGATGIFTYAALEVGETLK